MSVEQLIIGSILGDAHLSKSIRSKNAHYEEIHSLSQIAYTQYKAEILKLITPIKMGFYEYYDKRTNKTYKRIRLRTRVHHLLTEYYTKFYDEGKKIAPLNTINKLNDLGLAIWYMDDGSYCYQGRFSKIATCDFSHDDNLKLKQMLDNNFGLEPKIYYQKWPEIRFDVESTKKLLSIIKPHIISTMNYKLGQDDKREKSARETVKTWEKENRVKRKNQLKHWENTHRERKRELRRMSYQRKKPKLNPTLEDVF